MEGEDDARGGGIRRSRCCRELELREFPDKYEIRSLDPDLPDRAFSVGRSDGEVQPQFGDPNSESPIRVSKIYGVVGIMRLLTGIYVLVITSRKEAGSYLRFPIYCVTSMKFLSCNEASRHRTSQEKRDEEYFMSLLRIIESTPGLYYSYELDLTLNLQRAYKLDEGRLLKPLWKQADPRFVWNRNLLEDLIECKLDAFIIPFIQGNAICFTIKDSLAKVTLISRRCNRRLGTRMWRRGANLEGDAANFIETEQLLEFQGFRASFLQVRGSVPLLWEQIVDLSYKPRLKIINHEEAAKVVERHFNDLTQRYGHIVVLDLTDKHGDEGQLSSAYADQMEKLPHVTYVSFDFHHHCSTGNFDSLQILYNQITEDVQKQGYFLIKDGVIMLEQGGVVRANCVDCLDRTNVTQSYLAGKSLDSQLQQSGLFSSSECISLYGDVNEMFKILWAEHGDEISLQYTGTHALKGDLIRYGKQTVVGLIKDGITALSRYFLNNFQDGQRQDALDLISGRYDANRSIPPFQIKDSSSYIPVASALIIGGLTVTSFSLNQGRHPQNLISSVLWAGLTAGMMAAVKANGRQFCSRPRLCGLF